MRHLKKITFAVFLIFLIPQVAFAAWWNPLSWFDSWSFFHKKAEVELQVPDLPIKQPEIRVNLATSSLDIIATTTETTEQDSKKISITQQIVVPQKATAKVPEKNSGEQRDITPPTMDQPMPKATTTMATLPNGTVLELDANGGIIRVLYEALGGKEETSPKVGVATSSSAASSVVSTDPLEITSASVSSTFQTMTLEWNTNRPSNSKTFLSGGSSPGVYISESGVSTHHIVHISSLEGATAYSYEIEAIAGEEVAKREGSYSTKQVNENASLKITSFCTTIFPGTGCSVEVAYFENGKQKNTPAITIKSDDNGMFIQSSTDMTCIGDFAANSSGSQRKGNPLTCGTEPSPMTGKPVALFGYLPAMSGERVLTATANGATASITTNGQIPECNGYVRGEGVCQL